MGLKTFTAALQGYDQPGTWTFLVVPFSAQEIFGARARIPVKGTINGIPFRSSLMPRGDGNHFLVVNKALQKAAKAGPGDEVEVRLERETGPRKLDLPSDLKEALAADQAAGAKFEALAYSHQKAYLDWIESAKHLDTRKGRIEKTMSMVLEGKRLKG